MKGKLLRTTCAFVVALVVFSAIAQPPGKGIIRFRKQKPLRTVEQFESVKKGDTLGLVCLQCHSLAEMRLKDSTEAMTYCKEGSEVICPACKKTYKTVTHGPPGKGSKHRHVMYVNDQGVPCAFMSLLELEEDEE